MIYSHFVSFDVWGFISFLLRYQSIGKQLLLTRTEKLLITIAHISLQSSIENNTKKKIQRKCTLNLLLNVWLLFVSRAKFFRCFNAIDAILNCEMLLLLPLRNVLLTWIENSQSNERKMYNFRIRQKPKWMRPLEQACKTLLNCVLCSLTAAIKKFVPNKFGSRVSSRRMLCHAFPFACDMRSALTVCSRRYSIVYTSTR